MDADKIQELIHVVSSLLDRGDPEGLRRAMEAYHPADIADALERLPEALRNEFFSALGEELEGDVLLEMDEATRSQIVEDLGLRDLSNVLQTMQPDEAADIVGELPHEQSEEVLDQLPDAASERIEDLLQYDEESAGGIMTPVLIRVRDDMTVAQAINTVQQSNIGDPDEDFFYMYVVDAEDRLAGVVRIRKLLVSPPDRPITGTLAPEVASVTVDADQEEIADKFQRYDYLAMPVVDHDGKLVGRITIDDVVDVITEEATEDVYKMAGTDDAELATHSVFKVAQIRMTWLFVCMAGTMVSAAIIHTFNTTLRETIGLMVFVPAIMAMGGNSGLQTLTVTVRGLATGDIDPAQVLAAFLREFRVALVVGGICGLAVGAIARVWLGQMTLGVVVGASMFFGITLSATFGAMLPLLIKKLGGDPAVACGPLITTTNDITSLCIYLGLARWMIGG